MVGLLLSYWEGLFLGAMLVPLEGKLIAVQRCKDPLLLVMSTQPKMMNITMGILDLYLEP